MAAVSLILCLVRAMRALAIATVFFGVPWVAGYAAIPPLIEIPVTISQGASVRIPCSDLIISVGRIFSTWLYLFPADARGWLAVPLASLVLAFAFALYGDSVFLHLRRVFTWLSW